MVSVRPTYFVLPVVLLTASLLGGCSFMRKHFDRKEPAYQNSPQERPLEVPPDLSTPNTNGALVIPPASAAPAAPAAAQSTTPPGYSVDSATATPTTAPATAIASPGAAISGDGLQVADSVESTWARVGLALERSGAATISARDESAHTYTVQTTGQAGSEPGWFKRAITLGRAKAKSPANVPLTVRVSADGAASRVSVEGATDDASRNAARALLSTLRQRLS